MKKVISRVLVLCLMLTSAIFVSACGLSRDKNIKTISIIESTIPEHIVVGEFDNAGIKALITYEDDTTAELSVTSDLIPEEFQDCLTTPGIYEIEIVYRGASTTLEIKIIDTAKKYMVRFYDDRGLIINTQFVDEGEDAILPDSSLYTKEGYSFIGWDREYTNITEDIDLYAIYTKVESQITDEFMHEKLMNAHEYFMTNSHYLFSETSPSGEGGFYYDYDKETGAWCTQTNFVSENRVTFSSINTDEFRTYDAFFYEGSWRVMYGNSSHENGHYTVPINEFAAYGGDIQDPNYIDHYSYGTATYTYQYSFYQNREIYIATKTYEEGDKVEYIYDDESLIKITVIHSGEGAPTYSYEIQYIEMSLVENLIPNLGDVNLDGEVNADDIAMLNSAIAGDITLTQSQRIAADASLDYVIDATDVELIQKYIDGEIDSLPVVEESDPEA